VTVDVMCVYNGWTRGEEKEEQEEEEEEED
jgi:hypothetical protein